MKVAKDIKIVAVEGTCSCGGPLVMKDNGSFTLRVIDDAGIICQDCGTEHRLPKWIEKANSEVVYGG
jgi:RNase P subunit RPR2